MTRKEAIQVLESMKSEESYNALIDLCNMAISALSLIDIVDLTNGNTITKAEYDGGPSDLISRAEAIKAVAEHFSFDDGCSNIYKDIDYYKGIAEHILKNVPSALPSVDRPSGKWQQIEVIDDDEPSGINTDASECSVCGVVQQSHYWATHYYSYCPNCGARMENK